MAEGSELGMYCLGCYYDLRGIDSNRCPECGRFFDPGRSSTFSRQSQATPVRDFLKRVGKVIGDALAEPAQPDPLRRLRSHSAWMAGELDHLRRTNDALRLYLDLVLDVLVRSNLVSDDDLAAMEEQVRQIMRTPLDVLDEEGVVPEAEAEEPPNDDLLELRRAADEIEQSDQKQQ